MQSNHANPNQTISSGIPDNDIWQSIVTNIQTKSVAANIEIAERDMRTYKMEYSSYVKGLINYLLNHEARAFDDKWIALFRFILHNIMVKDRYIHSYFILELASLYKFL